jgi:putative oxidoreductase
MQAAASLLSRLLIAAIFLLSAVGNKIPHFQQVAGSMAAEGVPLPQVALIGAIVFLIVGSLSVMAGFKIRWGAALLLVFLVLATYFFHDFWNAEGPEQQLQRIQFLKNVSLMGALLFLMANGAGALSWDARRTDSVSH